MPGPDFGGYIWSSEAATPENSLTGQALTLGTAAALGVGAFSLATRTRADNSRPLDWVMEATRWAGERLPLQIGNTFRIPEFLSPWSSVVQQGLELNESTGLFEKSWAGDTIKNQHTYEYVKKITGLSDGELSKRGFTKNLVGSADQVANKLVFSRSAESARGALYSVVGDTRHLLSEDIQLFNMAESYNPLEVGKLNRAAEGVFQATGMYDLKGVQPYKIFESSDYMPIPSVKGRLSSVEDFWNRTASFRAVPAFEAQRFNHLLKDFMGQVFGEETDSVFKRLGVGALSVRPGTSTQLYARFGGKMAALGAAGLGVAQLDHYRREFGIGGNVVASGAVSAGAAYLANRAGLHKSTSLAIGAASFFGQTLMPGFDQGLFPGIVSTYASASIFRATPLNPFSIQRRTIEGFAPGITSWQMGALLGVGALTAAYGRLPGRRNLPQYLLEEFRPGSFLGAAGGQGVVLPRTTRQNYAKLLEQNPVKGWGRDALHERNKMFSEAGKLTKLQNQDHPLTSLFNKALTEIDKTSSNNFVKQLRGLGAQFQYSLFGLDPTKSKDLAKSLKFMAPIGRTGRATTIFGGVLAAHQLLTGGMLGSMESADTLRAQYSGQELVEVKKARWWEGGGTPFEGGDTSYFRPSQVHLYMNRVRERGIWGEDEPSPFMKFFKKNFTYDLERQNYYNRPYPVSSAAFAEIPIIGGALAATVGRLVKPAKLMHTSEWIQEGEGGPEFAHVYQGEWREPSYAMGAKGPGIPLNPYRAGAQLQNIQYQFRELEGLTGWAKNLTQKILTGTEGFDSGQPMLADASAMTSQNIRFWETNMGGLFFTNELVRRIFPRYRRETSKENPIMNTMPSWLPEKYRYGDPYRAVEWGEARLPGVGYTTLHPELAGLDAEDYPMIYRYQILADVAPHSSETRGMKTQLYNRRMAGQTSESENMMMDQIDDRLARIVNIKEFDRVNARAIQLPGSGITQGLTYGAEQLIREMSAPAEFLIPFGFRPVQKFMNDRDAVDQYEYERMYGTQYAFWDKPIRDWFRPSAYSALHLAGFTGKPSWRQEADANQKYFDQLEFVKWMQLAQAAEAEGRGQDKRKALTMASRTRQGVNPQGNPLAIYWSLPDEERAFLNAFSMADGADRSRILEMVPEDQHHLYKTLWSRRDAGDPTLWAGEKTPVDEQYLQQQYIESQRYLQGQPMPEQDWIGWNQNVDIDDIRIKYLDTIGRDLHDFGLWESGLDNVQRQPFLQGSDDYLPRNGWVGRSTIAGDLYGLLKGREPQHPHLAVHSNGFTTSSAVLEYNDDRMIDIVSGVLGVLGGY